MSPVQGPAPSGREAMKPTGIVGACLAGWRAALGMPGIIILKWLVNLAFSAAATLPAALLLHEHLGQSAVADEAFAQVGIDIAMEFALTFDAELRLAALAMAPVVLVYLFISLYLTGGILDRLRAGAAGPWGGFFAACNRHIGMLVRVGLLTLLLFAGVVVLPYYGLELLVGKLSEDAAGPAPIFYATWVHWGIVFLLGSWVARVYDYSRIAVVLQPDPKAREVVLSAMSFVWANGGWTFLMWLLLTLGPLIVLFAVATVPARDGYQTMLAMWMSLAVGQALVVFRITGSFAVFGGQMRFMTGAEAG